MYQSSNCNNKVHNVQYFSLGIKVWTNYFNEHILLEFIKYYVNEFVKTENWVLIKKERISDKVAVFAVDF